MLPILLKLLLTFLCTGLLHLSYHFELDAAGLCGARVRLRHTVTYLQARQYRSCHQGELPSGKFKEYEHAKCRRVVKTRESGGKIRQDSKIENQ